MWLVRIVPFCRESNGDAQAGVGGEGFDVGAAGEVGLNRRRLAAGWRYWYGWPWSAVGAPVRPNSCAMPCASAQRAIQGAARFQDRRSAAIRCQHPRVKSHSSRAMTGDAGEIG